MAGSFGPRGYEPGDNLLMCQRSDLGPFYMVAGSVDAVADCGHPVVVSPSGAAQLERMPELRSICLVCFTSDDRLRQHEGELARAPGVLEELQESMGDRDGGWVEWLRRNTTEH
jgi:hypothetical protein